MNIALTCDHLLSDDHYTQCLSSLLEIFPQTPIYTLAHRRGSVPSSLQERTIHASYISQKIANPRQFTQAAWTVPKAAEHLIIPCSTNLIFSFSSGLGHGIKKCKKTKQIVYLYKEYTPGPGFKQKFFASYVKSWSRKKLATSDHLWVSNPELMDTCRSFHPNVQLVKPGSKVECFLRPTPLVRPTFYAVEAPITSPLRHLLEQYDHPWKPLESASTLKESHALISLQTNTEFPERILNSLALGNPVIIRDTPDNRNFFQSLESKGVTFIQNISQLPAAMKECPFPVDPQPLRSFALQYGEHRFKSAIRKLLKNFSHPLRNGNTQ